MDILIQTIFEKTLSGYISRNRTSVLLNIQKIVSAEYDHVRGGTSGPWLSYSPDIVESRKNFVFGYLDNMSVYLPENSNLVSGEHILEEAARVAATSISATGTYEFRKSFQSVFFEKQQM